MLKHRFCKKTNFCINSSWTLSNIATCSSFHGSDDQILSGNILEEQNAAVSETLAIELIEEDIEVNDALKTSTRKQDIAKDLDNVWDTLKHMFRPIFNAVFKLMAYHFSFVLPLSYRPHETHKAL